MKSGVITCMCTNSPSAPPPPLGLNSCTCMQNWLNNLEPLTSHLKMEGATQRDPGFHLPRLYYYYYPQLPRMDVSGSQSVAHHKITSDKEALYSTWTSSPKSRHEKTAAGKKIRTLRGQCKHKSFSIQGIKQ